MTTILYVDCFSGVSGDMLLGALLDAGLPLDALRDALATLPLAGYELVARPKESHGIRGTKLDVLVDEAVQPERRLGEILALLDASALDAEVRATAAGVFRRLAVAEARIHGTTVDAVHFHEVGGVDSIVDVVGAIYGLRALGVERVFASSLPLPGGTIRSRHGLLPAPAPATLEVLAAVGAPTRPSPAEGELVTPTGAAILAEVARFEQPRMRVRRIGYGYGTKAFPWPNAVRVWLGEPHVPSVPAPRPAADAAADFGGAAAEGAMASMHEHPHPHPPGDHDADARAGRHAHPHPDHPTGDRHGDASGEAVPRGEDAADAPARAGRDDDRPATVTRPAGGSRPVLPPPEPPAIAADAPEVALLGLREDEVVLIETNLDDASPELLGYAMERLFAAGALDVYFTPIQMKKNRPGTLLGIVAPPERAGALAAIVLAETTTLGVRMHRARRLIAERRSATVETPFGPVRVKQKLLGGRAVAAPEYEDCARLARERGVPLADVYRAAARAADAE